MLLEKVKSILRPYWYLPLVFKIRGLVFNFSETLLGYPVEKKRFKKKVGYDLDLKNPKSLNQKIVWKKIYDRNPLLVKTSDKYAVRDYVREVLGDSKANDILVPIFFAGKQPENIPFSQLPEEYVIKANHDSGGSVIVQKNNFVDRQEIISKFNRLLSLPYGLLKHEWAYWNIERKIIVEKLLRESNGDLAQDYKFHVFHGKCRFIHTTPKVNGVRTGKRSLFTPEWEQLPVGWKHPQGPYINPPNKLKEMLDLAERLAKPFDYVRVDFYNPSEKIYFGELTHYHGNGQERFYPESFDFEAGSYWDIMPDYWKKNSNGTK